MTLANAAWTLAASAFNWTPDVVRAERSAPAIAIAIVADGLTDTIEIEPGQTMRSFPTSSDDEVDAFRQGLEEAGGAVSIVGASLDDVDARGVRRSLEERESFLLPQLRAAQRMGALGVRLPIGQAGSELLQRVLPVLRDLDLVLFEEIQGQQTPDSPHTAPAVDAIATIDDPHLRLLVDISMLMPSLPPSYLEELGRAGIPADFIERLASDWRSPDTAGAVFGLLRSGAVPPAAMTLYMDMIVRFGRSDASVLRDILPMVGGFHLKFWDLDDTDGRVSQPIADLAVELRGSEFAGTLCSEWGGHEWLEDDPTEMTRRHLAIAREALSS
ncbi:restriction endonuclease subunit R [Naasia lichenicola]|uniref:Restriction endonuclease subunit R n=1 Tax=Naasia lichenicola TaxID=2565933 RepID=A0A4S4FN05_9MICO|nr:restriction endonuclease subunit R [Naasia lichenicola]THG31638.1 restriction endonuclease subunit R [Naasia lichenicola]